MQSVEELLFDSVVSVFVGRARVYSNRSRPCISIGSHFEILKKKSNNVQMGRPRITKLSGVVVPDDPPCVRDMGPRCRPVSPLEGAEFIFSISIFSATAADIATILSLQCAT